jgi:hypothetical protein
MTRRDAAWWVAVIFMTAEMTMIAAYPDEALAIVRKAYQTCWKYLPLPEGAEAPSVVVDRQ